MNIEGGFTLEQNPIPEKLYRGFVVNPEELSLEMFDKPLVMGLKNEADSTKSLDGNEAGVYMSSNPSVIECTNYGNRSYSSLEVPRYASAYGLANSIQLPGCGIMVEVTTKGLDVRKPQISPELQGHYNNGFQGDEWIADEVPAEQYRLVKLTLSLGANDRNKVIVEVEENNQQDLERAINEIKTKAEQQRKEAHAFKTFLEGLTDQQRLNQYIVDKKWKEFQANR